MLKLISRKKGMTLVEVLISIAILGIISVPLLAMFTNSALMIRQNEKQIKVSALVRTIKENVSTALKGSGNLPEYGGVNYDSSAKSYNAFNIAIPSTINSVSDFIGITGSDGSTQKLRDYKYKITYLGYPDEVNATNTKEYKIKIYNSSDKLIQSIVVDINSLP